MMETKGILLAGVGGQGIIRASDILCHVVMAAGLDVKKSEVHGMAQRGGSVTSHVRYGDKVHSPLAKKNDIDILVSFEKMDTLRYLAYVKGSGTIIVNTETINPPAVNLGETLYTTRIVETLQLYFKSIIQIDALAIALLAGNIHTVNTVLLGTLSSCLNFPQEIWEKTLEESFPKKNVDVNYRAFRLGRDIHKSTTS